MGSVDGAADEGSGNPIFDASPIIDTNPDPIAAVVASFIDGGTAAHGRSTTLPQSASQLDFTAGAGSGIGAGGQGGQISGGSSTAPVPGNQQENGKKAAASVLHHSSVLSAAAALYPPTPNVLSSALQHAAEAANPARDPVAVMVASHLLGAGQTSYPSSDQHAFATPLTTMVDAWRPGSRNGGICHVATPSNSASSPLSYFPHLSEPGGSLFSKGAALPTGNNAVTTTDAAQNPAICGGDTKKAVATKGRAKKAIQPAGSSRARQRKTSKKNKGKKGKKQIASAHEKNSEAAASPSASRGTASSAHPPRSVSESPNVTETTAPANLLELFRPSRAAAQRKRIDVAAAVRTARGDKGAPGSQTGSYFACFEGDNVAPHSTKNGTGVRQSLIESCDDRMGVFENGEARPMAMFLSQRTSSSVGVHPQRRHLPNYPTSRTSVPVGMQSVPVGTPSKTAVRKSGISSVVAGVQGEKKGGTIARRGTASRRGGRKKASSSTISVGNAKETERRAPVPGAKGKQKISNGDFYTGTRNKVSARGRGGRQKRTVRKTGRTENAATDRLSPGDVSPPTARTAEPTSPFAKSPLRKKQKTEAASTAEVNINVDADVEPLPAKYVPDPVIAANKRELTWLLGKAMLHITKIEPTKKKHPNTCEKKEEVEDIVYISGRLREIAHGLKEAIEGQKRKEQGVLAKRARLIKEYKATLERSVSVQAAIRESRGLPVSPTTPPVANAADRSGGYRK